MSSILPYILMLEGTKLQVSDTQVMLRKSLFEQ